MSVTLPGVTSEMVEESSQASVDAILKKRPFFAEWMNAAVKDIVKSRTTPDKKFLGLLSLVKVVAADIAPHAACDRGCSHCCNMTVVLGAHEAFAIGRVIGVTPQQPPPMRTQEEYVSMYERVPCPFLKNHACSIYAYRPIACRTHFNISKYPELCDIVNYPGSDVPNLDLRPIWTAAAMIYGLDEPYGDIREYFPNGATEVQSL